MVYNVQSHIPLNGLICNWPNQLFHVSTQVEIANSGSHHLEPIDVAQGPTLMVPKLWMILLWTHYQNPSWTPTLYRPRMWRWCRIRCPSHDHHGSLRRYHRVLYGLISGYRDVHHIGLYLWDNSSCCGQSWD